VTDQNEQGLNGTGPEKKKKGGGGGGGRVDAGSSKGLRVKGYS